jgi:hypothetical protein
LPQIGGKKNIFQKIATKWWQKIIFEKIATDWWQKYFMEGNSHKKHNMVTVRFGKLC